MNKFNFRTANHDAAIDFEGAEGLISLHLQAATPVDNTEEDPENARAQISHSRGKSKAELLRRGKLMVFSDSTKGYHEIKTKNHAKLPLQTNKKAIWANSLEIKITCPRRCNGFEPLTKVIFLLFFFFSGWSHVLFNVNVSYCYKYITNPGAFYLREASCPRPWRDALSS